MKLSRTAAIVAILTAASFMLHCASKPPVKPVSPEAASIAVEVELATAVALFGNQRPDKVFFAQVQNGQTLSSAGLLSATWVKDNRAYLFNAAPGEYVAVAVQYKQTQQK